MTIFSSTQWAKSPEKQWIVVTVWIAKDILNYKRNPKSEIK